jgi:hypothetical protein
MAKLSVDNNDGNNSYSDTNYSNNSPNSNNNENKDNEYSNNSVTVSEFEDEELPWEKNEREKKSEEQSFLSKYWMLLILIILLAALPFAIFKINFGKAQQSSNSAVNSNSSVGSSSQKISGPYINNQEFDSLFNTTNFNVQYWKGDFGDFLIIYNSTYSTKTKIANNTYVQPLNNTGLYYFLINNITGYLMYGSQENITTSSNEIEETISLVGATYQTPKPTYVYSSLFSQDFSYFPPFIDNKTYNGMEYSIVSVTEPRTYNSGDTSIPYNITAFLFLGVKNNNVYNLNFIINNYSNIKSPTFNITKLVSILSNFN